MSRTRNEPQSNQAAQAAPPEPAQDFLPAEVVPPATALSTAPHNGLGGNAYVDSSSETIWENPADHPVAVVVHVGSQPRVNRNDDAAALAQWRAIPEAKRREMQTGLRTYVIPARSRRSIPSEFDQGIQQTQCRHPDCATGGRYVYCRSPEHAEHRLIVGGGYPRLINRGTQFRPLTKVTPIHESIDDTKALAAEALRVARAKFADAEASNNAMLLAQHELAVAQQKMAEAEARLRAQQVTGAEAQAAAAAISAATGVPSGQAPIGSK